MKHLSDRVIHKILVELGYLMPTTDEEISAAIIEAQTIAIPAHIERRILAAIWANVSQDNRQHNSEGQTPRQAKE